LQIANLFATRAAGPLTGLAMLSLEARTLRPDPYLPLHHDGVVRSLAFSPSGAYLASASNDRTVKVYDLQSGQTRTYRGHTDIVLNVSFSPDSKLLASAGMAYEVKFWDPAQDQQSRTLGEVPPSGFEPSFPNDSKLAISPDSKLIASTSDHKTVRVWEAATGKEVRTFRGHESDPIAVAFSADSKLIASGGGRLLANSGEILIWEVQTGKVVRKLTGHTGRVRSLAFSLDGRYLASGSEKERELFQPDRTKEKPGTVILWNAATSQALFTLRGYSDSVQSLAFSRDSKLLASASDGGVVKLHDVATGQELFTLPHAGTCVALNRDGTQLAVGSGRRGAGSITVSETATAIPAFTLEGHGDQVAGVDFSPDGKRLASASHDGTVRLWYLHTRQEILNLKQSGQMECVLFSPDGQFLAAVGGYISRPGRLWIWDAPKAPEKKQGKAP
jgi:WD40 repeat protein